MPLSSRHNPFFQLQSCQRIPWRNYCLRSISGISPIQRHHYITNSYTYQFLKKVIFCSSLQYRSALVVVRMRNIQDCDSIGLWDDSRDQRLRPFPKSSEWEPKRTNSIALLFLSNQIKTLIIFLELRGLSNFFHKLYSSIDAMKLSKVSTRTTPASWPLSASFIAANVSAFGTLPRQHSLR